MTMVEREMIERQGGVKRVKKGEREGNVCSNSTKKRKKRKGTKKEKKKKRREKEGTEGKIKRTKGFAYNTHITKRERFKQTNKYAPLFSLSLSLSCSMCLLPSSFLSRPYFVCRVCEFSAVQSIVAPPSAHSFVCQLAWEEGKRVRRKRKRREDMQSTTHSLKTKIQFVQAHMSIHSLHLHRHLTWRKVKGKGNRPQKGVHVTLDLLTFLSDRGKKEQPAYLCHVTILYAPVGTNEWWRGFAIILGLE